MKQLRKLWYYSAIRFYVNNLIWNYQFWFLAKKVYTTEEYTVRHEKGYLTDETKILKKFQGYDYKGTIYLDNPGMPIKDRVLWLKWKNKGLIK